MSAHSAAPDRPPVRLAHILLVLAVLAGLFFSIRPQPVQAAPPQPSGQPAELRVLATTFPVYLFTRNVAHSCPYVRVELLIPAQAGCPHDYAPAPRDLQKLAQAQVVVMNGLGLEEFLAAPLKKINAKVAVIDSSKGIDPLPLPRGMSPSMMDSAILPSGATLMTCTFTVSPSCSTAAMSCTYSLDTSEMWTMPTRPSGSATNAPNGFTPVTRPSKIFPTSIAKTQYSLLTNVFPAGRKPLGARHQLPVTSTKMRSLAAA